MTGIEVYAIVMLFALSCLIVLGKGRVQRMGYVMGLTLMVTMLLLLYDRAAEIIALLEREP